MKEQGRCPRKKGVPLSLPKKKGNQKGKRLGLQSSAILRKKEGLCSERKRGLSYPSGEKERRNSHKKRKGRRGKKGLLRMKKKKGIHKKKGERRSLGR